MYVTKATKHAIAIDNLMCWRKIINCFVWTSVIELRPLNTDNGLLRGRRIISESKYLTCSQLACHKCLYCACWILGTEFYWDTWETTKHGPAAWSMLSGREEPLQLWQFLCPHALPSPINEKCLRRQQWEVFFKHPPVWDLENSKLFDLIHCKIETKQNRLNF